MKFMKFQTVFLIVIVMMILIGPRAVASPRFDFLISSEFDEPLDEHIDWCLDYKVTTEARAKTCAIPNDSHREIYVDRLRGYFIPNNLVPYQRLQLSLGNNVDGFEWTSIESWITAHENDVIDWLESLAEGVEDAFGTTTPKPLRFRLYNEVNTFKTFSPENYYRVMDWFYPLFKQYGPDGATLVISLAGSEVTGDLDYRHYLREMLKEHLNMYSSSYGNPNNPVLLPFDGMDLHGYHTRYEYWSDMYQDVKAVFHEVLGSGNRRAQSWFDRDYMGNLHF